MTHGKLAKRRSKQARKQQTEIQVFNQIPRKKKETETLTLTCGIMQNQQKQPSGRIVIKLGV